MTNFKAVSEFNELIGNAVGGASIDQINKQMELIRSEFKELETAVMAYDIASARCVEYGGNSVDIMDAADSLREIRDGIADVLVTTYGLAHRMGIDADKDMKAVSESNFSKFYVGTESQAQSVTYALAKSLGIAVIARERGAASQPPVTPPKFVWAFISADDSDPERPRGKLLKAPGYKPPVFD